MRPLPSVAPTPRMLLTLPRTPNTPEHPVEDKNSPSASGSAQGGSLKRGADSAGTGDEAAGLMSSARAREAAMTLVSARPAAMGIVFMEPRPSKGRS